MNKKLVVFSILIIIIAIVAIIFLNLNSQEKPQDVLDRYVALLNEKNYEEMYQQITKE